MAQVEFIYNGITTVIQCDINEKMEDICKKFKIKNKLENKIIFYSYNGNIGINEKLTFVEFANSEDKNRKKMSILVFEENIDPIPRENDIIISNTIICPQCNENIKMDVKDYKINLHGCKNYHNIKDILLNEFEETQKIDRTKIICDQCKKNNKSKSFNNIFYKCLTCKQNICPLCKSQHEKTHKIINYDEKYYICDEHYENFVSYCELCEKNLCTLCEEHRDHPKILYLDALPNKNELIEKQEEFKTLIKQFDNDIDILIDILKEVKDKIDIYYKINENIINNYSNKLRNYETIYYLNQYLKNNTIYSDLENEINTQGIVNKFSSIFDIYSKMRVDEIDIEYYVKGQKEIRIFGETFANRYKNVCKLLIDDKEQELNENYSFGFFFATSRDTLQVKLKNISNIINAEKMFSFCFTLLSLPNISKWDTSKVTNMGSMFHYCSSLQFLPDISTWDTSRVTDMSYMFESCDSLLDLPDISKWNTSNVTSMENMFSGCQKLISFPDISKWNTSKVSYMNSMFSYCESLITLPDISKWDTSNVTDIRKMFSNCKELISLPDISKWNTSKLEYYSDMFYNTKESLIIPEKFKEKCVIY